MITVKIEQNNGGNPHAYVAIVYAALLKVDRQKAQEFLDRLWEEDSQEYGGVGIYKVIDVCKEFVDLEDPGKWW